MKKRAQIFTSGVDSRLDPKLTMTAMVNLDTEYRQTRAALIKAGIDMTDSMDALYREWRWRRDNSRGVWQRRSRAPPRQ